MVTQTKQPQDAHVVSAKKTARGLFVCIANYWLRVDGNERYFNEGAVILLDTQDSNGHFSENYVARYSGDPAGCAAPTDLHGGTTDPVILHIVEHWLIDDPPIGADDEAALPVPTLAQAEAELPILRATRRAFQKAADAKVST